MASNEDRNSPSRDASELASQAAEAATGQNMLSDFRINDLLDTAKLLFAQATKHPAPLTQEYNVFLGELKKVVSGTSDLAPEPGDKRFADPIWKENKLYSTMLQSYLALDSSLKNYAGKAGLEAKEAGRATFLLSQVSDALAPTNFLLGNPVALKRAVETNGKSLLEGFQNFLGDVVEGRPIPSQVDGRSFKVGENLAVTPGHVVLRTEMFELLQYSPRTEQVRQRPILVIPSIINKYYAFDLAPGRSLCEYIVKRGFTLFTMVWKNPQTAHDHWGMEAYMDAMDAAIGAVHDITGVEDPSVFAVCGAGPVLVSLAGYYAASKQRKIGSLTLMVSPLDTMGMAQAKGIGDFMDPEVTKLTKHIPKNDRISANEFTLLFAMLRPNDLIWNYWINNYLMGNKPPVFDVLYWNADGTGMTAQYNKEFSVFSEANPLVTPGAMTVKGTPIADIAALDFDSYVVAALTDHICVWPAVYRSAQMLGDRSQFVLSGSGHVQTIVSPPGNAKSHYFLNPSKPAAADEWFKNATKVQGTWWDHIIAWWTERSGPLVAAPSAPGNERHPPLGKAPGTYVFEKAS
jgi:polyhydroxyalkanoate synthase